MNTPLKNILRFTAIAALFTIFCLVGARIIKDDNWLNIKLPIAGNDNSNIDPGLNIGNDTDGNLTLNNSSDGNTTLDNNSGNNLPLNNSGSNNATPSDNVDANLSSDGNATPDNSAATEGNPSQPPTDITSQPKDNSDFNNESSPNNNSNIFTKVPPEYFDDALFIGDSRTVGLMEYGSIKNATFFATTGMDIYKIYSTKINVGKQGKIDLMSLLKNNKYSKVYIMLGINELGYNFDNTIKKYSELIDTIRNCQPDAIIYIEANMHVSGSRSASDSIFNNANINKFNHMLASLADTKNAYYLDVNPLFDDANGNLRADYTYDNTHVLGKHYKTWTDWIAENAVAKPN